MPINAETVDFIAFHPKACRFHPTEKEERGSILHGYSIETNTGKKLLEVSPVYESDIERLSRLGDTLLLIATLAEYEYYQPKNGQMVMLNRDFIDKLFC